MATHHFTPDVQVLGHIQPTWDIGTITDEIGVYAASVEFVRNNCGPIANELLDGVSQDWFDRCAEERMLPNIDIRVHRLNRGEYPAVPGWHCDGALRETYFGQPDRSRIRIRDTILGCVSTHPEGVCNPEYATEPITVDIRDPDNDGDGTGEEFVLWREIHRALPTDMATATMPDGQLTQMSCDTLHRTMPAKHRGARVLFRMSMWHNDYLGNGGRIARTAQVHRIIDQEAVYVTSEDAGW